MGFANPIADGNGALITVALMSPNYIPGVQGWAVFKNGNFELNGGIFRGNLVSANYVPGVQGWFLNNNGNAELNQVIIRGAVIAAAFSTETGGDDTWIEIGNNPSGGTGNGAIVFFSGNIPVATIYGAAGGGWALAATDPGGGLANPTVFGTPAGATLRGPLVDVRSFNGRLILEHTNGTILSQQGGVSRMLTPLRGRGAAMDGGIAPAVGSTAQQYWEQAGSDVVATDASGFATINFPSAFPSNLLTVVLSNGDQGVATYGLFTLNSGTAAGFTFRVINTQTSGVYGSQNVRCNWIAKGW